MNRCTDNVLYYSLSERNEKRNIAHRVPAKAQARIGSVQLPQEPPIGRRPGARYGPSRLDHVPIFGNWWQPVAESAKIPRTGSPEEWSSSWSHPSDGLFL